MPQKFDIMILTNLRRCMFICVSLLFLACSMDHPVDAYSNDHTQDLTQKIVFQAETYFDFSYGDHIQQRYDIYLPANRSEQSTKVLILVHGGGWRGGDKSTLTHYITSLQESNPEYAIVNMNYITATPGVNYAFPSQFLDIKNVINSIKQNRSFFQVQPQFGLIGASAGGHLAMMYDYAHDAANDVKIVCSIAGPTNFNHPFFTERPDFPQLLELLVNPSFYPNIENGLAQLSPVNQVTENSSPTLMFYGNEDRKVPISNAYQLKNSLDKNNVINSLIVFEEGHGNWSQSNREILNRKLSKFIYRFMAP